MGPARQAGLEGRAYCLAMSWTGLGTLRTSVESGRRKLLRQLGPTGLLAVLATVMPAVGSLFIFGFLGHIAPWLKSHAIVGLGLYVVTFWLLGGLSLLPTYSHSLLGGWTFGFAVGYPAALVSFTGAAGVAYLLASWISGDRAMSAVREHPRWQAVYDALLGRGFMRLVVLAMLLRIPPMFPFGSGTVVMAAARTPLLPFLIGTFLGLMPRTAFVVYTGTQLRDLAAETSPDIRGMLLGLGAGVAVLIILSMLARKAIERATQPAAIQCPAAE